jgi:lipopolysaccharide transport system ATP-binding protein
MSDIAITAKNLSKSYRVGHQSARRESYTALRDAIARETRNFARKTVDLVRGRQIVQGDEVEEFWALRDVSFEVKRGEVLGIIGRNGAGKSTLLKILSRITEPDRGRAILRGRVASLLEVGTGFHPELTGRENIFLNGTILGMTRAEIKSKIDEIVAFAEVERFLDTPVKRYSSGMYVRLAFSIAAHLEPEILVVDEVLAVGDAEFQSKCLGKMQDVASRQGRTILFVSHNMAVVQHVCKRAILLHDGYLAGDDEPRQIVRKYMADTSLAGKTSLRNWKDRVTNGDAMITDFEVYDEHDTHIDSVLFGGTVRFVMTVEFRRTVARPLFGVVVHSADGEAILDLRSSHAGVRPGNTDGRITVVSVVKQIGLYPGEYTLSPWVYDEASKVQIDWTRHCCRLRVIAAPSLHGDLRLDPKWGRYFVPSSWSIHNSGRNRAASSIEQIAG